MAVTKQIYTAAASWTLNQKAALFQSAFIDAGLMVSWYDSFLSGTVENRVLEITYNGSKVYGKVYYWFIFTSSAVTISVATGWDAITHVPTGTQYLDYYATTTNATTNHYVVQTGATSTTAYEVIRYTASGYSWFTLRNGAVPTSFFIAPASTGIVPWIDLDKVVFHHFVVPLVEVDSPTLASSAHIEFQSIYSLRRSFCAQGAYRGITTISYYNGDLGNVPLLGYLGQGNNSGDGGNFASATSPEHTYVRVPYGFNNANPAYATNYLPVINGYSYSNYTTSNMPADFGLFFNYGVTAFSFGDRIIVTAGVEEWEVYAFANNNNSSSASALLVARVV